MFAYTDENGRSISLSEMIAEDFCSFQPEEWNASSLRDPSPERDSIRLQEEEDDQFWQSHIQLCKPLANVSSSCPLTCERQIASVRRWKNAYDEGSYTVHTSFSASSWGDDDYEEMAKNSFSIPNAPIPPKPKKELPEWWDRIVGISAPVSEPVSLPAVTIAEAQEITEPSAPSAPTVRIQLTVRVDGKYVAGMGKESADNVQVRGATMEEVVNALGSLQFRPRIRKPHRAVRVQVQNLVGGSMKGGGNFQVHNATVPEIAQEVRLLLDADGLYTVGAAPRVEKGAEGLGISTEGRVKSEEGSRKPAKPLPISRGGGDQTQHTEKPANDRASLMADLMQMIEG